MAKYAHSALHLKVTIALTTSPIPPSKPHRVLARLHHHKSSRSRTVSNKEEPLPQFSCSSSNLRSGPADNGQSARFTDPFTQVGLIRQLYSHPIKQTWRGVGIESPRIRPAWEEAWCDSGDIGRLSEARALPQRAPPMDALATSSFFLPFSVFLSVFLPVFLCLSSPLVPGCVPGKRLGAPGVDYARPLGELSPSPADVNVVSFS